MFIARSPRVQLLSKCWCHHWTSYRHRVCRSALLPQPNDEQTGWTGILDSLPPQPIFFVCLIVNDAVYQRVPGTEVLEGEPVRIGVLIVQLWGCMKYIGIPLVGSVGFMTYSIAREQARDVERAGLWKQWSSPLTTLATTATLATRMNAVRELTFKDGKPGGAIFEDVLGWSNAEFSQLGTDPSYYVGAVASFDTYSLFIYANADCNCYSCLLVPSSQTPGAPPHPRRVLSWGGTLGLEFEGANRADDVQKGLTGHSGYESIRQALKA
ncbi:uncharacterized protein EV420DRAFT_1485234 [Desarmillaria tabescens]|uniref:Uncharacterized protein n=1 Tax=Armillaria tabescens TaxID=1929756 RepID=A0AA39MQA5_ARMTA|nr:uncharacterized protein EV420DRAFT_1485234 [Desarmillaria tabescens]KAK0442682.1 hypothetical protein EV420DRAFT_1485234 [Desarmillaria tabescens]